MSHPFDHLTPDLMLDALDGVGFLTDGRLLALNSFENRVYQIGQEEGPPVIVKFYRPQRWSDEQILEEHRFSLFLVERDLPVVAPLQRDGRTLFEHGGFRFAVFPRAGGHAPELANDAHLEQLGRTLARWHACGNDRPYRRRPTLDVIADIEKAAAQLTEEVGEVARIIARRYGEQSEKESDKNKDLGEELADVIFVVLCLANQTGVNLEKAFEKKLELKTKRDHDRHHGNEKLK